MFGTTVKYSDHVLDLLKFCGTTLQYSDHVLGLLKSAYMRYTNALKLSQNCSADILHMLSSKRIILF